MSDEIAELRAKLSALEDNFHAWRRASAALLARLRPLLPPAAETALAAELAQMIEEEEDTHTDGEGWPYVINTGFLAADRD